MTKDEFTQIFRAIVGASDLTEDDWARGLKTGKPTISRWLSGANAPQGAAREVTLAAARNLATSG